MLSSLEDVCKYLVNEGDPGSPIYWIRSTAGFQAHTEIRHCTYLPTILMYIQ